MPQRLTCAALNPAHRALVQSSRLVAAVAVLRSLNGRFTIMAIRSHRSQSKVVAVAVLTLWRAAHRQSEAFAESLLSVLMLGLVLVVSQRDITDEDSIYGVSPRTARRVACFVESTSCICGGLAGATGSGCGQSFTMPKTEASME